MTFRVSMGFHRIEWDQDLDRGVDLGMDMDMDIIDHEEVERVVLVLVLVCLECWIGVLVWSLQR